MKRILLIVDPQNDFITGTLAVNGAKDAIKALNRYIKSTNYDFIAVTQDTHPKDHCSFEINGGIWPVHCVYKTKGWKIPIYLHQTLSKQLADFYYKGFDKNTEEFSAFPRNELLKNHITESIENGYLSVDICGIAGDYCVLETLKGLMEFVPKDKIRILTEYIASIDGGIKLNDFIKENGITKI